jgi:hypothetical protein
MFYISRKTGRKFSNKQAYLNHLRKVYGKSVRGDVGIYLYETQTETIPKCKICKERDCEYISIFEGFSDMCNNRSCREHSREILSKSRKSAIDFANMVYTKTTESDFLEECPICDVLFDTRKTLSSSTCGSHYCRSQFKAGYQSKGVMSNKFVSLEYYKKLFETNSNKIATSHVIGYCKNNKHLERCVPRNMKVTLTATNIEFIFFCPITEMCIPFVSGGRALYSHVKSLGVDYVSYLKEYCPQAVCECKLCGAVTRYSMSGLQPSQKPFCSSDHYYQHMTENPHMYTSEEKRNNMSHTMRGKIESGDFTPHVNKWANVDKMVVNGIKYRSSWEVLFHKIYPNLEYETLRIPYFCSKYNKDRVYIVDFVDNINKIVYEVKPFSHTKRQNFIDKSIAAEAWCESNGYKYVVISEDWFVEELDALNNLKEISERESLAIKQFRRIYARR